MTDQDRIAMGRMLQAAPLNSTLPNDPGIGFKSASAPPQAPHDKYAFLFGEGWPNADHSALANAKRDEAAGMPRNELWRRHLWGRTPSGKWMTESDDSGIAFSDKAKRELIGDDGYLKPLTTPATNRATPILDRDLLTNDATSPPHDQSMTTFIVDTEKPNGAWGFGTEVSGAIPAGYKRRRSGPFENPRRPDFYRPAPASSFYEAGTADKPMLAEPLSAAHVMELLMHERQHKADNMSGLMPPRELRQDVRKFHDYLDYEVRADAAAKRQPLTMEQRHNLPPWQSFNVPEKNQFAIGDEAVRVPSRFKQAYDEDQ
jgi:hypothetical protein